MYMANSIWCVKDKSGAKQLRTRRTRNNCHSFWKETTLIKEGLKGCTFKRRRIKKSKVLYNLSPRLEPLDSELCCQHTALYYASICPFGSIGKTRILIQSSDLLVPYLPSSAKWVRNWKKKCHAMHCFVYFELYFSWCRGLHSNFP